MRWQTIADVASMLEEPVSTTKSARARGELDGIVTKRRGSRTLYHPEAAWFFACHGRPAESLDEAYAWAETHPVPDETVAS